MFRALALSVSLLTGLAVPTLAADIYPEVYGVAQFFATQPRTEIITFGSVLPGGGRAFDFGQFGPGGSLCTTYTGQPDFLCASASARVEIERIPVATTTYIGTITAVRLKAQVHLDYRNASAYAAQIWAKASLIIPLKCNSAVAPPIGGLRVSYRLSGDHSISVSDGAVIVKAPRPFEECDLNGVCTIEVPTFECGEGDSTTSITLDLWPIIQIDNTVGHTGYSVQGVSDYSHTFSLEGFDVLDTNGDPLPNVRVVVPDGNGGTNDVFLTATEALEVAAASTTTTTIGGGSTSTSIPGGSSTSTTVPGGSSTSTTTPGGGSTSTTTSTLTTTSTTTSTITLPCQTRDLAAARCRCDLRPVAGCEAVTLKGPIARGVNGLCAKVEKAASVIGKKQLRLVRKAANIGKRALKAVNGKKGNALPPACRDGLRAFVEAEQSDLAGTPQ